MVQVNFNAQQYSPEYGNDFRQLAPCKKVKVAIVDTNIVATSKGTGQMLVLKIQVFEGPMQGQEQIERLLLWHVNPLTIEIANKKFSAYCHVIGILNVQDTVQLHNRPFLIDVDWQDGQAPTQEKPDGGFTEIKALYDTNGNAPGKNRGGVQQQGQAPQQPNPTPPATQQPNSFRPPDNNPNGNAPFVPTTPSWAPPSNQQPTQQTPNNWNNR